MMLSRETPTDSMVDQGASAPFFKNGSGEGVTAPLLSKFGPADAQMQEVIHRSNLSPR
jgi:hypothetical protein